MVLQKKGNIEIQGKFSGNSKSGYRRSYRSISFPAEKAFASTPPNS